MSERPPVAPETKKSTPSEAIDNTALQVEMPTQDELFKVIGENRQNLEDELAQAESIPGFKRVYEDKVKIQAAQRELDAFNEEYQRFGGDAIDAAQAKLDGLDFRSTADDHIEAKYGLRDAKAALYDRVQAYAAQQQGEAQAQASSEADLQNQAGSVAAEAKKDGEVGADDIEAARAAAEAAHSPLAGIVTDETIKAHEASRVGIEVAPVEASPEDVSAAIAAAEVALQAPRPPRPVRVYPANRNQNQAPTTPQPVAEKQPAKADTKELPTPSERTKAQQSVLAKGVLKRMFSREYRALQREKQLEHFRDLTGDDEAEMPSLNDRMTGERAPGVREWKQAGKKARRELKTERKDMKSEKEAPKVSKESAKANKKAADDERKAVAKDEEARKYYANYRPGQEPPVTSEAGKKARAEQQAAQRRLEELKQQESDDRLPIVHDNNKPSGEAAA